MPSSRSAPQAERRRGAAAQLFPDRPGRRRAAADHGLADLVVRQLGRRSGAAVHSGRPAGRKPICRVRFPGIGLIIALFGADAARLPHRQPGRAHAGRVRREPARPHADRAADLQDHEADLRDAVLEVAARASARSALVEFPAPGMWSLVFLSQPPSAEIAARLPERRARLVLPAVHAEPDHRLLLLRAAQAR